MQQEGERGEEGAWDRDSDCGWIIGLLLISLHNLPDQGVLFFIVASVVIGGAAERHTCNLRVVDVVKHGFISDTVMFQCGIPHFDYYCDVK